MGKRMHWGQTQHVVVLYFEGDGGRPTLRRTSPVDSSLVCCDLQPSLGEANLREAARWLRRKLIMHEQGPPVSDTLASDPLRARSHGSFTFRKVIVPN